MHDVKVELLDGTEIIGPMWSWKPVEGWFNLAGESGLNRIELRDVVSAQGQERTHRPCENCLRCGSTCKGTEVVDYLAKAKANGWKPLKKR